TPKPPLIEIPLKDAGALVARNLRDLLAWLKREEEFWGWIRKITGQDLGLQTDSRADLTTPLQLAYQAAAKANETSEALDLPQITAQITQYAKTGLTSASARAQYIESVRSRFGDVAAAAAVAEALN